MIRAALVAAALNIAALPGRLAQTIRSSIT